jgi:hypothetical protein
MSTAVQQQQQQGQALSQAEAINSVMQLASVAQS